jgi:hypothetical protein
MCALCAIDEARCGVKRTRYWSTCNIYIQFNLKLMLQLLEEQNVEPGIL